MMDQDYLGPEFASSMNSYVAELGYSIEWPSDVSKTSSYDDLLADLLQFEDDPVGFVYYAFPWGEPGTALEHFDGPEAWQLEILELIRDGIIDISEAIVRISIRSGHGIGKSAMVSILILWAMLKEDTRGVVTANSERQLRTKTWAELGKWFNLYIGKDLFRLTATSLFPADRNKLLTWRIDMIPWSEHNATAFQGLHNQGKRILIIFDEASEIPKIIWTTAQGALSDANTQIVWFAAGNPTEPSGEFYAIHQPAEYNPWITRAIDSRTVSFSNKTELNRQISADPEGLDSDIIRVRILGEFPRSGFTTFISRVVVMEAQARPLPNYPSNEPVILGVDVARTGSAKSVVFARQGRNARLGYEYVQGNSTMDVVDAVIRAMIKHRTNLVAIDGGGVGGGVIDRLRQLGHNPIEVQFGGKASPVISSTNRERAKYYNKRAEIWGSARDFLLTGCLLENIPLLEALAGVKQKISNEDIILLEPKDLAMDRLSREGTIFDMDLADAFCLTFAIDPNFYLDVPQDEVEQALAHQSTVYNPYGDTHEFI